SFQELWTSTHKLWSNPSFGQPEMAGIPPNLRDIRWKPHEIRQFLLGFLSPDGFIRRMLVAKCVMG
ncbi:MAG: hypothetical protein ACO3I1_03990, partial [Burkholderiales bacterium]